MRQTTSLPSTGPKVPAFYSSLENCLVSALELAENLARNFPASPKRIISLAPSCKSLYTKQKNKSLEFCFWNKRRRPT